MQLIYTVFSQKSTCILNFFRIFWTAREFFLPVSPPGKRKKNMVRQLDFPALVCYIKVVTPPVGHTVPETHPDRMPHNHVKGLK